MLSNNGAREVEVDSQDGAEDGKHIGVGFVEISKIAATQGAFSLAQNQLREFSSMKYHQPRSIKLHTSTIFFMKLFHHSIRLLTMTKLVNSTL